MAAGRLIFPGFMPVRDEDGVPIPGAKAYFYTNDTETLSTTYTDATLTVPRTNPVVADGAGVWPAIWADTATLFTVALTDASGVPLSSATWSSVSAAIDATLASATLATAAQTAAETAAAEAQAAQELAQAAASTLTGQPFSPTSHTPHSLATGLVTWALDQPTLLQEGATVAVAAIGAADNQAVGVITVVDPVTNSITVNVASIVHPGGLGPYAAWQISLAASSPGVSPARQVATSGLAAGGGDLTADRTITVTAAAAADVRTGTDTSKALTAGALVGAAAFVALADAATVVWDTANGFNAKVTLGGNRLIGAPTNLHDGLPYTLDITQDATGTRVPSWDAIWDWGSSGAPTLSTAAGKKDKVFAQYCAASGKLEASFRKSA